MLPMILSFTFVIATRVRRTRRSMIRGGLTCFTVMVLPFSVPSTFT